MTIEKQLVAVQKKLTAIKLKVDNLIEAVEKSETKVAKPSKAKVVKAKPVKKAAKAKASKKAPKAAAKDSTAKVTAADQVLNIINKLENGVDAPTLVKETGFKQKKIANIIQRILKQGKIQRADRGIYVAVKL
jgi:hypothetical protein